MGFKYPISPAIDLGGSGRISEHDARRQYETAREILVRLVSQPGLILADEVGMGKTFVALAVAASVALQDAKNRPVVIMVPSSLREKWPRDFVTFKEACLKNTQFNYGSADSPVTLLKLLGADRAKRPHVIFLTHGAMSRDLKDGWVKLAIIYRALHRRHGTEPIRRGLSRCLGNLLNMRHIKEPVWDDLLGQDPVHWLAILHKHGIDPENDGDSSNDLDPVPNSLREMIWEQPADDVFHALQAIPLRKTESYDDRIRDARSAINKACRKIWSQSLKRSRLDLPLLILDEAHHLKNGHTRIASLFRDNDAEADADELTKGELAESFARMLFLTATPFQLGHHELIAVLQRFKGIQWGGQFAPTIDKGTYANTLDTLLNSLDQAQYVAMQFDAAWGKLTQEDLKAGGRDFTDSSSWWEAALSKSPDTEPGQEVKNQFFALKEKMKTAEQLLSHWIIRHIKPRILNTGDGAIERRLRFVGRSILPQQAASATTGLEMNPESWLPFLLASRAVATSPESRPVYSEGLSSSYEAFLDTKRQRAGDGNAIDSDDDCPLITPAGANETIQWYLHHIQQAIPLGSLADSLAHPKVEATVARTMDLWVKGEKVVVFCHYIATGKSLRRGISHAIKKWVIQKAAELLQCQEGEAEHRLEKIGDQFFRGESAIRKALDQEVTSIISKYPDLLEFSDKLNRIVRRNIRTPTFLVRFFPLGQGFDERSIANAFSGKDESGLMLREVVDGFFQFLSERKSQERSDYIEACLTITPRTTVAADTAKVYGPDEDIDDRSDIIMPNVRLANGATRQETRQKLMLAFNTPFYPEVLIASSIMAEGVDLHLNCRNIIHHDLCWNPSTLEQRTGRIDRIGSKMERSGRSINVYLPFIAETQDEKMFRVVMDREKWFNVVMGEKVETSFAVTEKLAERLPLPDRVVEELMFDFSVVGEGEIKNVA